MAFSRLSNYSDRYEQPLSLTDYFSDAVVSAGTADGGWQSDPEPEQGQLGGQVPQLHSGRAGSGQAQQGELVQQQRVRLNAVQQPGGQGEPGGRLAQQLYSEPGQLTGMQSEVMPRVEPGQLGFDMQSEMEQPRGGQGELGVQLVEQPLGGLDREQQVEQLHDSQDEPDGRQVEQPRGELSEQGHLQAGMLNKETAEPQLISDENGLIWLQCSEQSVPVNRQLGLKEYIPNSEQQDTALDSEVESNFSSVELEYQELAKDHEEHSEYDTEEEEDSAYNTHSSSVAAKKTKKDKDFKDKEFSQRLKEALEGLTDQTPDESYTNITVMANTQNTREKYSTWNLPATSEVLETIDKSSADEESKNTAKRHIKKLSNIRLKMKKTNVLLNRFIWAADIHHQQFRLGRVVNIYQNNWIGVEMGTNPSFEPICLEDCEKCKLSPKNLFLQANFNQKKNKFFFLVNPETQSPQPLDFAFVEDFAKTIETFKTEKPKERKTKKYKIFHLPIQNMELLDSKWYLTSPKDSDNSSEESEKEEDMEQGQVWPENAKKLQNFDQVQFYFKRMAGGVKRALQVAEELGYNKLSVEKFKTLQRELKETLSQHKDKNDLKIIKANLRKSNGTEEARTLVEQTIKQIHEKYSSYEEQLDIAWERSMMKAETLGYDGKDVIRTNKTTEHQYMELEEARILAAAFSPSHKEGKDDKEDRAEKEKNSPSRNHSPCSSPRRTPLPITPPSPPSPRQSSKYQTEERAKKRINNSALYPDLEQLRKQKNNMEIAAEPSKTSEREEEELIFSFSTKTPRTPAGKSNPTNNNLTPEVADLGPDYDHVSNDIGELNEDQVLAMVVQESEANGQAENVAGQQSILTIKPIQLNASKEQDDKAEAEREEIKKKQKEIKEKAELLRREKEAVERAEKRGREIAEEVKIAAEARQREIMMMERNAMKNIEIEKAKLREKEIEVREKHEREEIERKKRSELEERARKEKADEEYRRREEQMREKMQEMMEKFEIACSHTSRSSSRLSKTTNSVSERSRTKNYKAYNEQNVIDWPMQTPGRVQAGPAEDIARETVTSLEDYSQRQLAPAVPQPVRLTVEEAAALLPDQEQKLAGLQAGKKAFQQRKAKEIFHQPQRLQLPAEHLARVEEWARSQQKYPAQEEIARQIESIHLNKIHVGNSTIETEYNKPLPPEPKQMNSEKDFDEQIIGKTKFSIENRASQASPGPALVGSSHHQRPRPEHGSGHQLHLPHQEYQAHVAREHQDRQSEVESQDQGQNQIKLLFEEDIKKMKEEFKREMADHDRRKDEEIRQKTEEMKKMNEEIRQYKANFERQKQEKKEDGREKENSEKGEKVPEKITKETPSEKQTKEDGDDNDPDKDKDKKDRKKKEDDKKKKPPERNESFGKEGAPGPNDPNPHANNENEEDDDPIKKMILELNKNYKKLKEKTRKKEIVDRKVKHLDSELEDENIKTVIENLAEPKYDHGELIEKILEEALNRSEKVGLLIAGAKVKKTIEDGQKITEDVMKAANELVTVVKNLSDNGKDKTKNDINLMSSIELEQAARKHNDEKDIEVLRKKIQEFESAVRNLKLKTSLLHIKDEYQKQEMKSTIEEILSEKGNEDERFRLKYLANDYIKAASNTLIGIKTLAKVKNVLPSKLAPALEKNIESEMLKKENIFSGDDDTLNYYSWEKKSRKSLRALNIAANKRAGMLLNWTNGGARDLIVENVNNGKFTTDEHVFDNLREYYGDKYNIIRKLGTRHKKAGKIVSEEFLLFKDYSLSQARKYRDGVLRKQNLIFQETEMLLNTTETTEEKLELLNYEYLNNAHEIFDSNQNLKFPMKEANKLESFENMKKKCHELLDEAISANQSLTQTQLDNEPVNIMVVKSLESKPKETSKSEIEELKKIVEEQNKRLAEMKESLKPRPRGPGEQGYQNQSQGKDIPNCKSCRMRENKQVKHRSKEEADGCQNFKWFCENPGAWSTTCTICNTIEPKPMGQIPHFRNHFQNNAWTKRWSCPLLLNLTMTEAENKLTENNICLTCHNPVKMHGPKQEYNNVTKTCNRIVDDKCPFCPKHITNCPQHQSQNLAVLTDMKNRLSAANMNMNINLPVLALDDNSERSPSPDQILLTLENRPFMKKETEGDKSITKKLTDFKGVSTIITVPSPSGEGVKILFDGAAQASLFNDEICGTTRGLRGFLPSEEQQMSVSGLLGKTLRTEGVVLEMKNRNEEEILIPGHACPSLPKLQSLDLKFHLQEIKIENKLKRKIAQNKKEVPPPSIDHVDRLAQHSGQIDVVLSTVEERHYPEEIFQSESGMKILKSRIHTGNFTEYCAGGRYPPIHELQEINKKLEEELDILCLTIKMENTNIEKNKKKSRDLDFTHNSSEQNKDEHENETKRKERKIEGMEELEEIAAAVEEKIEENLKTNKNIWLDEKLHKRQTSQSAAAPAGQKEFRSSQSAAAPSSQPELQSSQSMTALAGPPEFRSSQSTAAPAGQREFRWPVLPWLPIQTSPPPLPQRQQRRGADRQGETPIPAVPTSKQTENQINMWQAEVDAGVNSEGFPPRISFERVAAKRRGGSALPPPDTSASQPAGDQSNKPFNPSYRTRPGKKHNSILNLFIQSTGQIKREKEINYNKEEQEFFISLPLHPALFRGPEPPVQRAAGVTQQLGQHARRAGGEGAGREAGQLSEEQQPEEVHQPHTDDPTLLAIGQKSNPVLAVSATCCKKVFYPATDKEELSQVSHRVIAAITGSRRSGGAGPRGEDGLQYHSENNQTGKLGSQLFSNTQLFNMLHHQLGQQTQYTQVQTKFGQWQFGSIPRCPILTSEGHIRNLTSRTLAPSTLPNIKVNKIVQNWLAQGEIQSNFANKEDKTFSALTFLANYFGPEGQIEKDKTRTVRQQIVVHI